MLKEWLRKRAVNRELDAMNKNLPEREKKTEALQGAMRDTAGAFDEAEHAAEQLRGAAKSHENTLNDAERERNQRSRDARDDKIASVEAALKPFIDESKKEGA